MPGRPLEAGDRVFGVAGESVRPGGHVLGAGSPKYEVLRSDQKVSESDHLGLQRVDFEQCPERMAAAVEAIRPPS